MGRVSKMTNAAGKSMSFDYDGAGNLIKYTDYAGATYEYDEVGNLTKQICDNKMVITYSYDDCNRLTKETVTGPDGSLICQYTYTLGKNGERIKITENIQSQTVTTLYAYDKLNRLVMETISDGTTSYTYNELNQLTVEVTGSETIIYSYDDNGNLIKKSGDTVTSYEYDLQNRLVLVTAQSGNDGSIRSSYLRGNGLIALEKDDSLWYYISDGHGSVRLLVSDDGLVTDRYDYDAYGNLIFMERTSDSNAYDMLRGITKDINSKVHLSNIRIEWNNFYKKVDVGEIALTKENFLNKALEIDKLFGSQFQPPR